MDVRDVHVWVREAKRRGLVRRLAGVQTAMYSRAEWQSLVDEEKSLKAQLTDLDRTEEIAATEAVNAERMAEVNAKLRRRQRSKRAKRRAKAEV